MLPRLTGTLVQQTGVPRRIVRRKKRPMGTGMMRAVAIENGRRWNLRINGVAPGLDCNGHLDGVRKNRRSHTPLPRPARPGRKSPAAVASSLRPRLPNITGPKSGGRWRQYLQEKQEMRISCSMLARIQTLGQNRKSFQSLDDRPGREEALDAPRSTRFSYCFWPLFGLSAQSRRQLETGLPRQALAISVVGPRTQKTAKPAATQNRCGLGRGGGAMGTRRAHWRFLNGLRGGSHSRGFIREPSMGGDWCRFIATGD